MKMRVLFHTRRQSLAVKTCKLSMVIVTWFNSLDVLRCVQTVCCLYPQSNLCTILSMSLYFAHSSLLTTMYDRYNPENRDTTLEPLHANMTSSVPTDGLKRPRDEDAPAERLNGEVGESGREDWMMVPGQGKSMEEMLGLGGEGFGKNRTFADAKGAKKIALAMSARGVSLEDDDDEEPKELTEAQIRSKEIMDRFTKSRGESLFDLHQKRGGSMKKAKGGEEDVYFDRERVNSLIFYSSS